MVVFTSKVALVAKGLITLNIWNPCGINSSGSNKPLRNIIGKTITSVAKIALGSLFVREPITIPIDTKQTMTSERLNNI